MGIETGREILTMLRSLSRKAIAILLADSSIRENLSSFASGSDRDRAFIVVGILISRSFSGKVAIRKCFLSPPEFLYAFRPVTLRSN